MKNIRLQTAMLPFYLYWATVASAQQPEPTKTATMAVPKLVQFSGTFRPANGMPAQPVEGVTLAVYRDQTGGDSLWQEVQNVPVDADGHYAVLLGATHVDGMPLDLFTSGEPRWLGVQFNRPGETERPRVLLASVPYALKASDADTLGGRPASAYLLASAPAGTGAGVDPSPVPLVTTAAPGKPARAAAVTAGIPNYIAKFADVINLTDSSMYETNGRVGIGTTQPLISLDARTGSLPQMGIAGISDYLTFFASDVFGPAIYWDPAKDMRFGRGGAGLYNPFGFAEQMRIQSSTGNVGIGTRTPGSKLDVAGDINFSGSVRYQGSLLLQLPPGVGPFGSNIGLGSGALQANTTGSYNTATGYQALTNNTSGTTNTATGYGALASNTTGSGNTAIGEGVLTRNVTGVDNTASGTAAMFINTAGNSNTAMGAQALFENTIGNSNTATGMFALGNNTIGGNNTASGFYALGFNTTGNNNIAIGFQAGLNASAGSSNNIHVGSPGDAGDSGTIRVGTAGQQSSFFAAGVRGVTTANNDAIPVVIDSAGQLGTVSSSERFKEDIEDMGAASRNLMRLRPVTYRYQRPFADGSKPIQYGLIAEEVAEIYPDLVAHSAEGQIETVKYQVLDAMLLNEVQRQQTEINALEQKSRLLQEGLAKLEAELDSMSAVLKSSERSISYRH